MSIVNTEILTVYLAEVKKIPAITKEEEQALFEKYIEHNDLMAMHRLVTAHLRFVVYFAKHFKDSKSDFLDIIQEGNTALMKSAKAFNPKKYPNTRFVSFARFYIKDAILSFLNKDKTVNFATTKDRLKIFHNSNKFDMEDQSEKNINHITKSLDINRKDVVGYMQWANGKLTLDGVSEEEINYESTIENDIDLDIATKKLHKELDNLNPRWNNILHRLYLADDTTSRTDLAKEYGITPQRIVQIEHKALKRLKEGLYDTYYR